VRAKSLVFHWFWRIIGGSRRESALIYVWEKRRKGRRKTRWREWWQSPDCAKYLGLRLERSAGFSPLQRPNWRGRWKFSKRAGVRAVKRRERRAPVAPGRRRGRGGFFLINFLAGAKLEL
jgi:hypothetical protein